MIYFLPHGVIKINFYASVVDTKSPTGKVIWNHNARLIQVMGKLLSLSSVPLVELIATMLWVQVVVLDLKVSNYDIWAFSIFLEKSTYISHFLRI